MHLIVVCSTGDNSGNFAIIFCHKTKFFKVKCYNAIGSILRKLYVYEFANSVILHNSLDFQLFSPVVLV